METANKPKWWEQVERRVANLDFSDGEWNLKIIIYNNKVKGYDQVSEPKEKFRGE